jgi:branched-chain amino acid transport system permease protein
MAPLIGGDYIEYLFLVMLGLCVIGARDGARHRALGAGLWLCRHPRRRGGGRGLGVPTPQAEVDRHGAERRLHGHGRRAACLTTSPISTQASGFSLNYAVNAIAMPLIGGTSSWLGPVVGAGAWSAACQEYLRVTISSAINVLVAGVLMVAFVIVAPARASSACSRGRSD